jgi:hypothetical protein
VVFDAAVLGADEFVAKMETDEFVAKMETEHLSRTGILRWVEPGTDVPGTFFHGALNQRPFVPSALPGFQECP